MLNNKTTSNIKYKIFNSESNVETGSNITYADQTPQKISNIKICNVEYPSDLFMDSSMMEIISQIMTKNLEFDYFVCW